MSYCGISIFSDNLSGQTANVTFFPCTGGTVNLGDQTFPFTYITDYWYGTYDCYVPTYAYTYTLEVPCPSPTPTPTSSETPTQTPTQTLTPTNTQSPTQTPTQTVSSTETQTPTPTATITPTVTPTYIPPPTPTPTPTSIPYTPGAFTFDADYIVVTYAFNDGTDLDTRTRVTTPNIGQNSLPDYIGWCCSEQWPVFPATPILTWGGDNTGTGFESTLIDLIQFKSDYPGENIISIDCNAGWYGTVGTNPVYMQVTLYKGGEMIADPDNYTFINNTFSSAYGAISPGLVVTLDLGASCIDGETITTLQYNLSTFQGQFI